MYVSKCRKKLSEEKKRKIREYDKNYRRKKRETPKKI